MTLNPVLGGEYDSSSLFAPGTFVFDFTVTAARLPIIASRGTVCNESFMFFTIITNKSTIVLPFTMYNRFW